MGIRRGSRRFGLEKGAASVLGCAPEDVTAAVSRIPGLAAELAAL